MRLIATESTGRVCWVLQNREERGNKVIFRLRGQNNTMEHDKEIVINYTEASVLLDYT